MNPERRRYLILHGTDLADLANTVNIFMDAARGQEWLLAGGPFSVERTAQKLREDVEKITGLTTITAYEETELHWYQAIYRP